MRFRFCGDQDCPDWLLAEISLLSKVSSVKMKLLANNVAKDITGTPMNYEKMQKLSSDAKFGPGDLETLIACISFIITNAAKYDVESDSLSNELQQLGLPKEHSQALCKSYATHAAVLQDTLTSNTQRLWKLRDFDWKVDYLLECSKVERPNMATLNLRLSVDTPEASAPVTRTAVVQPPTLDALVQELSDANELLSRLTS